MGTTFVLKQRQSFVLVLTMALALSAQIEGLILYHTNGHTFTFDNKLPYGFILYHPPGCCSQFSDFSPPTHGSGCARCPHVWVAPNETTSMYPIVGPYPLQYLQLKAMKAPHSKTYCLIGRNLNATNTLTIGPKECGEGRGIEAQLMAPEKSMDFALTICMEQCIG